MKQRANFFCVKTSSNEGVVDAYSLPSDTNEFRVFAISDKAAVHIGSLLSIVGLETILRMNHRLSMLL